MRRKECRRNDDTHSVLQIRDVRDSEGETRFQIIQDDLLHPVLGGNKLRKLDGLLPELQAIGCTDVVSGKSLPAGNHLSCYTDRTAYKVEVIDHKQLFREITSMYKSASHLSPCFGTY